ncbi:STAS domain-containing protein [Brucepastera parasyntrophica]|uniref:STAS domain-containing protein n=1 Tax=Brucepastera parasyntrophica TaxID=2880008 RepID=UPI00210A411A|nr:STAS domain-containing protein [Brucepastera parasyntrophica]ULQ58854.1 STAS domain-containing protein [Brucepastera parasyntrophica]
MENLTIIEKSGPNYILLEVHGRINSYTSADLEKRMYEAIKETNLVLDLSQVTNISSSGIGIIIAAYNDSEDFKHKLFIMKPSEAVRLALESTGFSELFTVIYSLTEVI